MKRFFIFFLVLSFTVFTFAEEKTNKHPASGYQITNVDYSITGCGPKFLGTTKPYVIENNVSINKNKIFKSVSELENYIKDYELRLNNTRAFEKIIVKYKYEISETKASTEIIPVTLSVLVTDSLHLLGLPYPKYNSNDGLSLKIKIKDTNFLGSMNEMNAAVDFSLKQKTETEAPKAYFGFEFGYDYPFKAGIFNGTWINDHSFSYTVGNDSPEWNVKTGAEFALPTKHLTYVLGFYQSFNRNFDYEKYNDKTYAGEEVKLSVPVTLCEIPNFAPLKYTPYLDFVANWDIGGINIENTSLSSPYLTSGHSLTLSRVNWENKLRTGIDASLTNTFKYNFQRHFLYPEVAVEIKAYKALPLFPTKDFMNRFGICADFYSFVDIYDYSNVYFKNDGTNIGSRIRGLRDYQNFALTEYEDWYALQTPAAIVLNLDFPVHIFQTNFTSKFMKYFNFDLQISPFLDIALTYNKATKHWFNPKDGLYAGGIEVLVYPLKWSSFTVRGSVGLDLGRYIFADKLNSDWRQNCSKYEISFGIGLHY